MAAGDTVRIFPSVDGDGRNPGSNWMEFIGDRNTTYKKSAGITDGQNATALIAENSIKDLDANMALADYINNKPMIETERLIIRPMVFSDVPALKEWLPEDAKILRFQAAFDIESTDPEDDAALF